MSTKPVYFFHPPSEENNYVFVEKYVFCMYLLYSSIGLVAPPIWNGKQQKPVCMQQECPFLV